VTLPPVVEVVLLALAWTGAVGLLGLVAVRSLPRRSVRSALVAIAVVGVASLVAGLYGAARAMFISAHDLGVVVQVSAVAGVPPFYAVSFMCGVLRLPLAAFLAIGTAGRILRFAAVFQFPALFR